MEDTLGNAHEHAYSALTAAAQALEGPGIPMLADFKDAYEKAKTIIDRLISEGLIDEKGEAL